MVVLLTLWMLYDCVTMEPERSKSLYFYVIDQRPSFAR